MYFLLSLLYSLLALAFQLQFTKKFNDAGFVVFWMLNYASMLAVGLALDAVITLLPVPLLPFFLLLFIIANVAVCAFPIEVLPHIYRYGYAMPFYNVSRGVRTILFATKNTVALTFGILIAWIAISCITIPLFQWLVRRHNRTSSTNAGLPSRSLEQTRGPTGIVENETRDSEKAEWLTTCAAWLFRFKLDIFFSSFFSFFFSALLYIFGHTLLVKQMYMVYFYPWSLGGFKLAECVFCR